MRDAYLAAHPIFTVFFVLFNTLALALIAYGAWLVFWFLYTVPRYLQRIALELEREIVVRDAMVNPPRPAAVVKPKPAPDSIVPSAFGR